MKSYITNFSWILAGLLAPIVFNIVFGLLLLPGLLIGYPIPYLIVSSIIVWLTIINIINFSVKISKKTSKYMSLFIFLVGLYSIASWYFFSIKEGQKQGFVFTTNNPHEYSNKHWYFLNRVHPLFPFTYNGSAYIDENHNLSTPSGYVSLAKDKQRIGWHSIISTKFYLMSFVVSIIYGLNISLFIVNKIARRH